MEKFNLLERLKKKSADINFDVGSDDESDIDDNITLDECEKFIDERKERFTEVQRKSSLKSKDSVSKSNTVTQQQKENGESLLSKDKHKSPTFELAEAELSSKIKSKKKGMTAEERQLLKELKEKEKSEKQKKREEAKLQKEAEKERMKALKDRDRMAARSEKKEECMDRILAVVDPCLVQESGGGDILKDLQDMNVRYELKALPVVCCVGWMRENVEYKVDDNRKVNKTVTYSEEVNIVHKINAFELATRIDAQKNFAHEDETFIGLVKLLKKTFLSKKITIVIVGLNAYHRLVKTKKNEEFRNKALGGNEAAVKRKKKEQLVPTISKEEIDSQLINLQLTTNFYIRFCEDMSDLSKLICSFSKAIAEAPFKKATVSSLEFSTMQSNKVAFKVCNDGYGISQVWNQQLQQFYGVRNDTSSAITQLYPTPLSLMKAYENLSKSEGEKLLQDIQIRRGVGVLQTQRRVGIELSKKIYKLFTSLDGDEALGK